MDQPLTTDNENTKHNIIIGVLVVFIILFVYITYDNNTYSGFANKESTLKNTLTNNKTTFDNLISTYNTCHNKNIPLVDPTRMEDSFGHISTAFLGIYTNVSYNLSTLINNTSSIKWSKLSNPYGDANACCKGIIEHISNNSLNLQNAKYLTKCAKTNTKNTDKKHK